MEILFPVGTIGGSSYDSRRLDTMQVQFEHREPKTLLKVLFNEVLSSGNHYTAELHNGCIKATLTVPLSFKGIATH